MTTTLGSACHDLSTFTLCSSLGRPGRPADHPLMAARGIGLRQYFHGLAPGRLVSLGGPGLKSYIPSIMTFMKHGMPSRIVFADSAKTGQRPRRASSARTSGSPVSTYAVVRSAPLTTVRALAPGRPADHPLLAARAHDGPPNPLTVNDRTARRPRAMLRPADRPLWHGAQGAQGALLPGTAPTPPRSQRREGGSGGKGRGVSSRSVLARPPTLAPSARTASTSAPMRQPSS